MKPLSGRDLVFQRVPLLTERTVFRLEDKWLKERHVLRFHEASAVCQNSAIGLIRTALARTARRPPGGAGPVGTSGEALPVPPRSRAHGRAAVPLVPRASDASLPACTGTPSGKTRHPSRGRWPSPGLAPWEQLGEKEVRITRRLSCKACHSEDLPESLVSALRLDTL